MIFFTDENTTLVCKREVADDALLWPHSLTLWPDKYQFPQTFGPLSQTKSQSLQLLLLLV